MNKNFPMNRFLMQYPTNIDKAFLPVLYGVFGKNWKGIKRFIKKYEDIPHLIEFHLCFRNPDPKMGEYARKIEKKMNKIGKANTKVIICPILEDQLGDKAWKHWAQQVRENCDYHLVRSTLVGSKGGKFQEKHGRRPNFTRPPRRRIANPDGISIDFEDGETYFNQMSHAQAKSYGVKYSGSYAVAFWSANQQGLGDSTGWGGGGAPPPKDREFIVTDEAIQKMPELIRVL